jgi:hypothetical protein
VRLAVALDPMISSRALCRRRADSSLIDLRVRRAAMTLYLCPMTVTVFSLRGIPSNRRERIEAAVVAGGRLASGPHEAWIASDSFNSGFRVLITGPNGFERTVAFAGDDDPTVIAERVRRCWKSKSGFGQILSGRGRPGHDQASRANPRLARFPST